MSKNLTETGKPRKPYGYVLLLRGLAAAAIQLETHPAALRVLCVAAEYMSAEGQCRIGQDTIAARLNISRQAVNRHLAVLDAFDILISEPVKDGVTKVYHLNTDYDERLGQGRVDERRKEKRKEKERKSAPPGVRPTFTIVAGKEADPLVHVGERVAHSKFGDGVVTYIEGPVAVVNFDSGQEKTINQAFLTVPVGATSEVAVGAIQ